MAFGGEHVSSLKAKTGPWAGQVCTVVRVHLDHAAISSLLGVREGKQEPIQSLIQRQPEPTNRARRAICDFA